MRKGVRDNLGFVVATVGLILLISFFVTETVRCESNPSGQEIDNYYAEKESVMLGEAKKYLAEEGFGNSGVMLTKVMEQDGTREYTLTVHHRKIDELTNAEREQLAQALSTFDFIDEKCTFRHKFLITE
ncbi:MAG: hypothetical protein K6G30_15405 [Acetatifactor sp.]|nr:hypothetical protein [Acetatifactor sp.]